MSGEWLASYHMGRQPDASRITGVAVMLFLLFYV